jgi:hypothetical protein
MATASGSSVEGSSREDMRGNCCCKMGKVEKEYLRRGAAETWI